MALAAATATTALVAWLAGVVSLAGIVGRTGEVPDRNRRFAVLVLAVLVPVAAAFFVAVFPGNIAQFVEHKDGFGLDTDAKRAIRLLFQPLLVVWALSATGAVRTVRSLLPRRD